MNDRADKLIDAIGKVDDIYIRKSMPMNGIRSEINNEIKEDITMEKTSNGLIEITVEKPSPKQIRNRRIRLAAVSGLAAALVITGGVLVWNKLGGLRDPFNNNGITVTTTTDTDTDMITEKPAYTPDIRNLKWGMTLNEVKAHETEKLIREEVLTPVGIEQTLLEYENVRYKDYFTTMVLCVEKEAGLSGVNYYVDKSQYPDAWNDLQTALCAEFGGEPISSDLCQWGDKQKNLSVLLMVRGDDVQVGFYPYIDPPEVPKDPSDDTTDDEYVGDWSDISTWKQYGEELEPVLPVYLPNMPDFDEESFDPYEDGYPRVMLKCIPNADPDGKTDIYLLAERVFADIDDRNNLYGELIVGIAKHGSDTLNGTQVIRAVYEGYLEKINVNDFDKYLQIFNIMDENGEPRTLIKYAYGESEPYYYTTFAYIDTDKAQLEPFGNLSGFTQTVDSGSPVVGMRLSGELEQKENEILDSRSGMAFSFDFEKEEISIRTFTVADDGSSEEETPQPADRDLAVKLRTFDITDHNYISHEMNPGERSLFNPGYLEVAGSTVYVGESGWTDSATILADVKDRLGDDYDSFEAAIKPYCNENGGLDFDKAWALPSPPTGELFRDLYYQTPVQFVYKVIDDKWMICVNENGEDVSVFMKNDKLTSIRRAAEYLWSVFDEYYDMTVTAIYNYETKEGYLLVVSDLCPEINAAMQRDCAADVANSCRFMTPGDIEPTWLPLTMLKESGGKTYLQHIEQLDIYNVAFDNGVFSGASWESAAETADRLKQLGQPDTARTFLQEFGNMPETVTSQDELMEALHENIKSFERMIPYASLFDPVKLPRYFEAGFTFYYSVGPQVLEVMAEQTDSYAENYRIYYRLLQCSDELTRIRYNVKNFRDNYTFNDPSNGFKGFTIKGIEVISVVEGLETKWQVRLIADESTWEEIERAYLYDMQLMPGDIVFASEPTDTSKLVTPIM